jgi:hypothetical protein
MLPVIVLSCLVATSLFADIYEWTDENGVKHFSNRLPPAADAEILMKAKEVPYDEQADRERMATDRQAQLEFARLEMAELRAELELREAEAERRLAEAERLMQAARQEADAILQDAESRRRISGFGHYGGYFGYAPIYKRWHHGKKKHDVSPPKRRYDGKKHTDFHRRNDFRSQHRPENPYDRYFRPAPHHRSGAQRFGMRAGSPAGAHPGLFHGGSVHFEPGKRR